MSASLHRARLMLAGFLVGVEAMAMMLAKGQVRAVSKNDMPAQRAFVPQIFGLAA